MDQVQANILVVEDDLYTSDLYKEILSQAGFMVTTAADGLEGMVKISDGGYDLIILDAMIPKIDGLTLLTRMQHETPKKPNGPVVILTNLARDMVLKQALAAGAMACLIKTDYNPDQLVAKIKEFIKKN